MNVASVNGTQLSYEDRGSGKVLLFLHGFTLDQSMWRSQVEELSKSFRVIAYDARGFGRSALPDGASYKHCEDAAALCDHLGVRRIVAIGHSIGGHQTLELALSRPDLVAGWVSIGMSGLASVPFPEDIMKTFGDVRRAARERSIDEAKDIWTHGAWFAPARERADLASELDRMLADYSGWHWTHDNPAKNLDPPAAQRLGDLGAAALVIMGGRDLPYNHENRRALIERIRHVSTLDLPNASHMANMEEPAAVNGAIAEFAERALA